MTGQLKFAPLVLAGLLTFASTIQPKPAYAFDMELTTSNDFFSGSQNDDDLYTADLGFDLRWRSHHVSVGERLFTDRERGLRFDETYATVSLPSTRWKGWWARVDVGVLHVGRGLLGQDAQNAVHRLFGMDEVNLDYVDDDRWYPTAELRAERRLAGDGTRSLHGEVNAFVAPGFRSWIRLGVMGEWQVLDRLAIHAGIGLMSNQVDFGALEPRVDDLAATWALGVVYRGIVANWSYNRYGTTSRHFSLGYRFTVGGGGFDRGE